MSGDAAGTSRAHIWLESLGDWAWPGQAAAAEPLPQLPSWIPAFPTPLEPALAGPAMPQPIARRPLLRPLRLLIALLLAAVVSACCALALEGSLTLQGVLGASAPGAAASAVTAAGSPPSASQRLPTLVAVSQDSAGSSIDQASFASAALAGQGSFIVYLPPGFASTSRHYPVLYLLHGRNGHAGAFLEIGLQRSLDRLIGEGAIAPMLVVMIQDRSGLNNWQDIGTRHSASYVVEVQQLIDRMLPTVPTRAARAIAGSSMGGFGAMHVALANPYRFAVVESWLGFFDNLGQELRADRPIISRLGLHAFLYGAEGDPVALPEEDPAFAARLRAAGAQARSAIFPGDHSLQKVREHLDAGLLFAGRSLAAAQRRAAAEEGAGPQLQVLGHCRVGAQAQSLPARGGSCLTARGADGAGHR
jgi:enterochelin esterase-like enzyme